MKKYHIFSYHKERGNFWFRVFGWGLRGSDRRIHEMLFSERMRIGTYFYLRSWSFKVLTPSHH